MRVSSGKHGPKRVKKARGGASARQKMRTTSRGKNSTGMTMQVAKKRRMDDAAAGNNKRMAHGPRLDFLDDFAAMRSLESGEHASRLTEVYEWVGDAVIGELVARCLLSQFHSAPLSARVFRNLRLGAVTNQNLAAVYEDMGYQRRTFEARKRKMKEKADIVEAIAGELVVRLEIQKSDDRMCSQLREHLDGIVACMLQQHFGERRRVHQRAVLAGPLQESFNAFACLPQEHLDEETGELVVLDGAMNAFEEQIARDSKSEGSEQKSFADLIEECAFDDKHVRSEATATNSFHGYAGDTSAAPLDLGDVLSAFEPGLQAVVASICRHIHAKLRLLSTGHVLLESREIFDVFKIYGMTLLAERVSLALAFPSLSARFGKLSAVSLSPSSLTTQRQNVLCMSNMAQCAAMLGIGNHAAASSLDRSQRWDEDRLLANSLRAFVGYHSAIAQENEAASVADDVAFLLQTLAQSDHSSRYPAQVPRRETLRVLPSAVRVTGEFMTSRVCDDLHQPGERPQAPSAPTLVLRRCDSDTAENLFETLAKQQAQREQQARRKSEDSSETFARRRKRKRSECDGEDRSNMSKPSANLTRFTHRRFLFCLEELVVLFAQRKTEECRVKMTAFESDLEPCAGEFFRKWEVSTSTLTLAMRDSFYRLLLHDLCHFHELASTSKNTRDGTRITQLRLPVHYTWAKVARRVTVEDEATG
ncbi:hypothetical protein Poli38472_009814 [Pythium oligandrum]|uniref:RNase III domain-containing protein n=1 Tax=Pythium oligandrum TaxID=41045 RepID=A0A8K1CGC8_PYTOL|nr:hypothetical protein Poli38472_009814 [Pythium oligandrum]|eukprot:TMW62321.1 hypothetical protein Poli38472_009814 [Pythium oligandrum]